MNDISHENFGVAPHFSDKLAANPGLLEKFQANWDNLTYEARRNILLSLSGRDPYAYLEFVGNKNSSGAFEKNTETSIGLVIGKTKDIINLLRCIEIEEELLPYLSPHDPAALDILSENEFKEAVRHSTNDETARQTYDFLNVARRAGLRNAQELVALITIKVQMEKQGLVYTPRPDLLKVLKNDEALGITPHVEVQAKPPVSALFEAPLPYRRPARSITSIMKELQQAQVPPEDDNIIEAQDEIAPEPQPEAISEAVEEPIIEAIEEGSVDQAPRDDLSSHWAVKPPSTKKSDLPDVVIPENTPGVLKSGEPTKSKVVPLDLLSQIVDQELVDAAEWTLTPAGSKPCMIGDVIGGLNQLGVKTGCADTKVGAERLLRAWKMTHPNYRRPRGVQSVADIGLEP